MQKIQGVQLMEGSNEEFLPGFTPEFPYIASCVDLYPNIATPVPWHWHRAVELFYMRRGTLEYTTPHGTMIFPEGSGGMINSNVLHVSRVLLKDENERPEEWIHLFDPDFLSGAHGSRMETKYILPLSAAPGVEMIPLFPENRGQKAILGMIRDAFAIPEDEWGYEFKLRAALSEIWLKLLEVAAPLIDPAAKGKEADDKIKMLMVYIHEHYAESIPVDQLAEVAHISRRACFRLFQENLHMTPVEYIRNYRLQKACYLLAESEEPITQIAYSCGLGSSSYFGKTFRERFDCAPLEYRRRWVKQNTDKE